MSHDLPLGLLSLYQPLSGPQREQAATLLRASLDEEGALEHEIDELSIALRTLHDILSEQRRESRVLAHLLAPIRRIPAEILAEIFAACVLIERADLGGHAYASDARWAPLRLAQVSSEWRSVAFASPQLWTEPVFQAFEPDRVLQMYLTYSGALPLDVSVDGGKPQRGSGTLPYLLRSERFIAGVHSLSLSLGATAPYTPVTLRPRFAQLSSLSLDFYSDKPESSICSRTLGFFSNAASLETLHLRFGSLVNQNAALPPRARAPTPRRFRAKLELERHGLSAASGQRVLRFLRACSSIRWLSLATVGDGPCDAGMLQRLRWNTPSGAANLNILPNLQTIHCPGIADVNLLEVVLSRVRPAGDIESAEQRMFLERAYVWVDVPSNAPSRMAEVVQYLIRREVLHCDERSVVVDVPVRALRV
ncbi:hypothetical protein MKEN_00401200 [Mycena kentingensis (nom. inval.)]|nr:hypothetical protein MKEN_00401200 [Mycena kentingensis (nom. inval.)]